jgi:hypothetical protein
MAYESHTEAKPTSNGDRLESALNLVTYCAAWV